MPGIVIFKRRWSVGSDDFVVPGIILLVLHAAWLIVLTVVLNVVDFERSSRCMADLYEHVLGYIVILSGCVIVEGFISWISMRGTILNTAPRASMQYLLYVRLGILLVEVAWLVVGLVWISRHYSSCPMGLAKRAVLGIILCNWFVLLSVLVTTWCTFDAAGRSWVKNKRYQLSLREGKRKYRYRRSGNSQRNWRHRKALRQYQNSWNKRCRLLFCCMGRTDRHRNSFAEIAKLLSDFFRDLDVVPSDVVAGLVLLRKFQQLQRQMITDQAQTKDDIYQFLSGVPVTSATKFLDVTHQVVAEEVKTVTHYLHYALAVYGWPMFMMVNSGTGCCQLCPYLKCCCLPNCHKRKYEIASVVDDNCCNCNYAALRKMCRLHNMEVVYATYHVEIGETPFFVALDHEKRSVVVSIRGTLSLQDVITDLNAEADQLPTASLNEEFLGHKGMVQVAEYIRRKLVDENILCQAFNYCPEKGTQQYDLVLVGHSLGAGAAAILAIFLKPEFPTLLCYAYSPPGGLLSINAAEYTKSFITSVVLGKDVVPRIGLHQMEALRSDLINAIKRSKDPKWKVILGGVICCCPEEVDFDMNDIIIGKKEKRDVATHPSDSSIALTVHQPLYPPGRIIHIVRSHSKKGEKRKRKYEPVYQALWANNVDFDEVLISPVMIQDHMPDKVLEALQKLLANATSTKIPKLLSEGDKRGLLSPSADTLNSTLDRTPPHHLVLETSFTDLHPDSLSDKCLTAAHLGWDYTTGTPVIISENYAPDRGEKLQVPSSISQRNDFNTRGPPGPTEDWSHSAPLASPETLSDISSISSKGSQQKLSSNGNRLSWGGIPIMEPITQSPVIQRPDSTTNNLSQQSINVLYEQMYDITMGVPRDNSTASLLGNCYPQAISSPLGNQIITEVTVEVDPTRRKNPVLEESEEEFEATVLSAVRDPSRLRLNIQPALSQDPAHLLSVGDSNYASAERTISRMFSTPETKHVTFELSDSQEESQERSTDSLYNSGESFMPSYPEYSTQQEYGSHLYMYPTHTFSSHSPLPSPQHSFPHSSSLRSPYGSPSRPYEAGLLPDYGEPMDIRPLPREEYVTDSPSSASKTRPFTESSL